MIAVGNNVGSSKQARLQPTCRILDASITDATMGVNPRIAQNLIFIVYLAILGA